MSWKDYFHSPYIGTYSGGPNIIDEGSTHAIEVDESHDAPTRQYEASPNYVVDDFQGPCISTYNGGAYIIDKGLNYETEVDKSHDKDQIPTRQYEANPNLCRGC